MDFTYNKEYEADTIEIHEDALSSGQKVLLIDDLLATGGTVKANLQLIKRLGGSVVGIGFLIELGYLGGRKALGDDVEIFSLINIDTPKG